MRITLFSLLLGCELFASAVHAQGVPPTSDQTSFRSDCRYGYATESTRRLGDRLLTVGMDRWMLFDTRTRRIVRSGDATGGSPTPWGLSTALMQGDVAVVPGEGLAGRSELRLIHARDGALIVPLRPNDFTHFVGLSPDGSYAWRVATQTLDLWSADGKRILSTSLLLNPYDIQRVSTSARQLKFVSFEREWVVDVLDGSSRVETFPPRSSDEIAEYAFTDGTRVERLAEDRLRFVWPDGSTRREMRTPQGISFNHFRIELEGRVGFGKYLAGWLDGKVVIYDIDAPLAADEAPAPVYTVDAPSGNNGRFDASVIVIQQEDKTVLRIIDLSGESVATRTHKFREAPALDTFSADNHGLWSVASTNGEIYARDHDDAGSFHTLGCRAP